MPKKVEFQIKMGRNGRATKITYEIRKIFSLLFSRGEKRQHISSAQACFTPFEVIFKLQLPRGWIQHQISFRTVY